MFDRKRILLFTQQDSHYSRCLVNYFVMTVTGKVISDSVPVAASMAERSHVALMSYYQINDYLSFKRTRSPYFSLTFSTYWKSIFHFFSSSVLINARVDFYFRNLPATSVVFTATCSRAVWPSVRFINA